MRLKKPVSEQITDVYLITMLLLFPLFFGFSGYSAITLSKFVFLLAATGLWVLALTVAACLGRATPHPLRPVHFAAFALAAVSLLSWGAAGFPAAAVLGAGRYDGLVSALIYLLIFLGVSLFSRPKPMHLRAFALAVTLCLLVALLQLMGRNPLRLFPRDLGFYDAGVRYSGFFLGTIGNTNILDAVLCLALPLFVAYYVCAGDASLLLPAALAVPVLCKAGGDGLKLAMLAAALLALPLLCTSGQRIRRFLRAFALLLAAAAVGTLWQPSEAQPLCFRFSVLALAFSLAALLAALLSFCRQPRGFSPDAREWRRAFTLLSLVLIAAGLAVLLGQDWQSGALYELSQMLRGHFEDSYASSRIRIWRACLALVPSHPLLGCGPGMLAAHVDILFSRFVEQTGNTLWAQVDNAHNVYLAALVNTGVLGLAAHLAILLLAARRAWSELGDPLRRSLALAVFCGAIHALFGLGLCLSEPLFWLALGLLCA